MLPRWALAYMQSRYGYRNWSQMSGSAHRVSHQRPRVLRYADPRSLLVRLAEHHGRIDLGHNELPQPRQQSNSVFRRALASRSSISRKNTSTTPTNRAQQFQPGRSLAPSSHHRRRDDVAQHPGEQRVLQHGQVTSISPTLQRAPGGSPRSNRSTTPVHLPVSWTPTSAS